ncbi:MAG TPA: phosphoadenylyl-sulfate reductase [Candidatus Latescibacteria bacterium]|jgi:phosphoadenosine phosphosulfate reductase|nr:phosphoadenylyl-sulfate reductase [Candidatus Latescibacterota bacterium]HJP29928.1 phosphoadenylyl-sulfate reductase [Candidatus Latescibacterota bacterium]
MTQTQTTSDAAAVDPVHAWDVHNERILGHLESQDFESMDALPVLKWAAGTFDADRLVLSTSFQYSGVAMIHMAVEAGLQLRYATIDTLRLHPETYAFLREVEARYDIDIEVQRPESDQVQSMVRRFGEYLFFDTKTLQEYCCQIRKVKPNEQLLMTVDCWISGMRRDQSNLRRDTPKAMTVGEYGSRRQILKLNPMADWGEDRLLSYIEDNDIPRHPLYDQGYKSIGCFICSTPVGDNEDQRAGRWRWFNSDDRIDPQEAKECGLHVPMYNI